MDENIKQYRGFLFFTIFERFSFFLLLAIFVLYCTDYLDISKDRASSYYEIFLGVVYFSPVVLGYLSDKFGSLKFFHLGCILSIIGFFLFPILSNFYSDIIFQLFIPLVFISIGAGILRVMVPVLIGKNSQIKADDSKIYVDFLWYLLMINIGSSFVSFAIDAKNNFINYFLISAIVLLIGYLLWLLKNRNKRYVEISAESQINRKRYNNKLLINVLIISIPVMVVFNLLQTLFQTEITGNFYPYKPMLEMLIFVGIGLILYRLKKLTNFNLVRLIKLGLIIIIVIISILLLFEIFNQHSDFFLKILQIIEIAPTTIVGVLLLFLVFDSSPLKYKGLFVGLYYTLITISHYISNPLFDKFMDNRVSGLIISLIIVSGIFVFLRDKKIKNIA